MEVIVIIGVICFVGYVIWRIVDKPEFSNPSQAKSKTIKYPSTTASEHHQKGYKLLEEGNYIDAIWNFNLAITLNPNAIYYNNRAYSKWKVDDYQGAIEDCTKAIQLAPNEALYLFNRGVTYINNNKTGLACEDWKKAAQLGSQGAKEMLDKYCVTRTSLLQTVLQRQCAIISPVEARLNEFGVSSLYHMTHKENLQNILQNGLLSHSEAHRGLLQNDIADSEVNNRRGRKEPIYNRSIHDYVPLYFNPKNPMLFKRREIQNDILILVIDRKVLLEPNTIFTDGNAASKSTKFFASIPQCSQLNWQCINGEYWNDYNDGKRIKCAEVLVFPKIQTSSIRKIYGNNPTVVTFVKNIARNFPHIVVEQNGNFYFDTNSNHHVELEEDWF